MAQTWEEAVSRANIRGPIPLLQLVSQLLSKQGDVRSYMSSSLLISENSHKADDGDREERRGIHGAQTCIFQMRRWSP